MRNLIACRIASYGNYHEAAWEHLPTVGIRHLEIPAPPPEQIGEVKDRLARHGLQASSVQASFLIAENDWETAAAASLDACRALGSRLVLAIVRPGGLPREAVWPRLRDLGDAARDRGVTIMLETHPELATNGAVSRETMRAVDHANVRINYDTANIHFYNEGLDTVAELEKTAEFVAGVHLKDSRGLYRTFDFPVLGRGIVDFPRVFAILGERGFFGPYTLELEVANDVPIDETGTKKRIEESVAYLRTIGAMP